MPLSRTHQEFSSVIVCIMHYIPARKRWQSPIPVGVRFSQTVYFLANKGQMFVEIAVSISTPGWYNDGEMGSGDWPGPKGGVAMEDSALIDRILEAERAARLIADEAREELEGLDSRLEAEGRKIREGLMARAQERLDKLRLEERDKKERAIAAQQTRLAEASARMERAYVRYGDNWVDTLFRQTVDIP